VDPLDSKISDKSNIPIKEETFDYIGDLGGLSNVADAEKAVTEAYRVLKKGGTMFSIDLVIKEEDIRLLPREFRRRMQSLYLPMRGGCLNTALEAGFELLTRDFILERELASEESEIQRMSESFGVKLRVEMYFFYIYKARTSFPLLILSSPYV